MIKNSSQLKSAMERLHDIEIEISDYREEFSDVDLELYITPLLIERRQIVGEIIEYKKLKELPLDIAVKEVLSTPIIIDDIGELLSKLRIGAKKTQKEMADLLGWEQSNLSRFESENYNSQTISKIVEYASALGVWLHVTPSLSEEPERVQLPERTLKTAPIISRDIVTTSSSISKSDIDLNTSIIDFHQSDVFTDI